MTSIEYSRKSYGTHFIALKTSDKTNPSAQTLPGPKESWWDWSYLLTTTRTKIRKYKIIFWKKN